MIMVLSFINLYSFSEAIRRRFRAVLGTGPTTLFGDCTLAYHF